MTGTNFRLVPYFQETWDSQRQDWCALEATSLLSDGPSMTSSHFLDGWLGNCEGRFSTTDANFSRSSRRIRIEERRLFAELKTSEGRYVTDSIAMRVQRNDTTQGWIQELIVGDDDSPTSPVQVVPSVALDLGDPCRNLRLERHIRVTSILPPKYNWVHTLKLDCLVIGAPTSSFRELQYDLDVTLGNRDGAFDADGHGFSNSARDVHLVEKTVQAELQSASGEWKRDGIALRYVIRCARGRIWGLEMTSLHRFQRDGTKPPMPYTSLGDNHREFRLCYIEPGSWDEPVRCRVVPHRMDEGLEYKCLSYVWGAAGDTHNVIMNSELKPTTRNLFSAMRRLRSQALIEPVWIDALCINQSDAEEKNAQVAEMAGIYGKAEEVIIWIETLQGERFLGLFMEPLVRVMATYIRRLAIGVHNEQATDEAIESIRKIRPVEGTEAKAILTLLGLLLQKSAWWRRSWTLQEHVLARRSVIAFSSERIDFETLREACNHLSRRTCCRSDVQLTWAEVERASPSSLINAGFKKETFDSLSGWLEGLSVVLREMEEVRMLGDLMNGYPNPTDPGYLDYVLIMLQRCRERKSSDPRDKLFAFANVSSGVFTGFQADYNMRATDVFMQFTVHAIQRMGNFDVWTLADRSQECEMSELDDLPSWAIDWTITGTRHSYYHLSRKTNMAVPAQAHAQRPEKRSPNLLSLLVGNTIHVRGSIIGTIERTAKERWRVTSILNMHRQVLGQNNLPDWLNFLDLEDTSDSLNKSELWESFFRLMTCNQFPAVSIASELMSIGNDSTRWRLPMSEDKELFRSWAAAEQVCAGEWPPAEMPDSFLPLSTLVNAIAADRKLFVMDEDHLGLGPHTTQPGDVVGKQASRSETK